jgi:catechol 2,3-dioxygenase-like lactoylglutathione lyase family enzyme
MSARRLEHYNVRTIRPQETVRFYLDILGLAPGPYPGKVVPGAWIYDHDGTPVVHIVSIDPFDGDVQRKADAATLPRPVVSLSGTGAIDHVAFAADNHDEMVARIEREGLPYRTRRPTPELLQLYLLDPNGILIELNFATDGGGI